MTIRRRLVLSFLAILVLFGLNLVIYFWSNQKRQTTVESLRRAISRQALISSLDRKLNDIQKQISLLSQVTADTHAGVGAAELAQFNGQLGEVARDLKELREAEDEGGPRIEAFATQVTRLLESWRIVYQNFGVNHPTAIAELAVRADPRSQEILGTLLPGLQKDESRRVEAASSNFYRVARVVDTVTALIFGLSILVAVAVAWSVSRYLTHGLRELKQGAASIGSGDLGKRIELRARDELGELAGAFNEMAERLLAARSQLELLHEEERARSEELARAMEQLRKAQDQLITQQKLASLGAVTAGIAHEIKNPLNFVTNFASLSVELVKELRETLEAAGASLPESARAEIGELADELEANMGRIREHGKRADNIVRNMLQHSRGKPGEREPTNINSLVSEYVKLAYHGMRAQNTEFNIAIEEHYDESLEPVSVVAQDLSRVFLNIANNACYAAFEKKKMAGDGFLPKISVSTRDAGEAVEIRFRDNGPGISAENRAKVFEPFFTTKPAGSGTGLGLSLSYDIVVQMHKGALEVNSEPGEFAEFVIRLPKASAGATVPQG